MIDSIGDSAISFLCAFLVIAVVWTLVLFNINNYFYNYIFIVIFIVIVLAVTRPLEYLFLIVYSTSWIKYFF